MARTRRRKRNTSAAREFDPARWAHLVFVLGGFLAVWVLSNFIESIWAFVWSYQPRLPRANPLTANLIAIVVALVATALAWRNKRWFKFVTEVVVEVSQVVWPTRPELRANTIVVISLTLIASVLLFGMDQLWSQFTGLLYGI